MSTIPDYLIFVATPLAPKGATEKEQRDDLERNLRFAEQTCRELALVGAATFGPHLYYTRFLSDTLPTERDLGIRLGLIHMRRSDEVLVRLPDWRGALSSGMVHEKQAAEGMAKSITVVTTMDEFSMYCGAIYNRLRAR